MNKKITMSELVEILAQKQNTTKRVAESFIRELTALMTDTISSGETLRINALGVFKPVWVEERASVNVQTGEPTIIPGHYKLTFTPSKAVREAINEPFACFCVEELPDDAPIVSDAQIVDEMADDTPDDEPVVPVAEDVSSEQPEAVVTPDEMEVKDHSIENASVEVAVETNETTEPEPVESVEVDKPAVVEDAPDCAVDKEGDTSVENEHSKPAEEVEKHTSKAYLKGIWMGVLATAVVFVGAIALLFFCFPGYRTMLSELPEYAGSFFADSVAPAVPVDTIVEEMLDSGVVDSFAVDSIVADTLVLDAVQPIVVDTIRRGVFLTNMSYKHYGHKAFWVYLYEENSSIIPNPDNVPVGTVIVIPPPEKYGIDANDTTAIGVALEKARIIKEAMR